MTAGLGAGLYTSSTGMLLLDLAARGRGVKFSTGEHGFQSFECFVPMRFDDAFYYYDRPGLFHIAVTEKGGVVWEGRLEDVAIVAGGVRLTALGYWRALTDLPYTALWSTTDVSRFRVLTPADIASCLNDRFTFDQENRLHIATTKNTVYGTDDRGALALFGPDDGDRTIQRAAFSYSFNMTAAWEATFTAFNDGFASGVDEWTLAGNGTTQTGTFGANLSIGKSHVWFAIHRLSAYTEAGESGDSGLTITNFRVNGDNAATVYASAIASRLVTVVNTLNSTQLSAATSLISSPAVDLSDEIYADELASDILDHLAALGDNSSPVSLYETGVWDGRMLSFQKRGSTARHWYVDISELELERTLEQLTNSVYATYQEAGGRTLRTSVSADTASVSRYGLTRRQAVGGSTTSSTQAGVHRDAALNDGKEPRPRIRLTFDALYDAGGARWPLWSARAWDQCTIRNLPPTLSTAIDRIRTFRILETDYDADRDELMMIPEMYPPSAAWVVRDEPRRHVGGRAAPPVREWGAYRRPGGRGAR